MNYCLLFRKCVFRLCLGDGQQDGLPIVYIFSLPKDREMNLHNVYLFIYLFGTE